MPRSLAIALLSLLLFAEPVHGEPAAYRLGSGDRVRLKVYEWRNAIGDVYAWAALNADFRVAPDGTLSLPLIGSVPAAGSSVEELAETISTRLQKAVGMAGRPQTSVEIVEFRPFYILGHVQHPGEYQYRPGMTVLQAVSIAGGSFHIEDPSLLLMRRTVLTSAGDLQVLLLGQQSLLARRARLRAELDGSAKIAFPPELLQHQGEPAVAQAIQREQAIFTARTDALRSQTDALNKLKDLLNGEIASLQSKMKDVDQELALLKGELSTTSSLVQRGLAAAPREFSLRQTELQTQGRRLDLDTAALRAHEDIGKADQSILELRNKMRAEDATELAQVDDKLTENGARIKTAQAIAEQESAQPDLAAVLAAQTGPLMYSIIRRDNGGVHRIAAAESTDVEPGDTIEVRRGNEPVHSVSAGSAASPAGSGNTTEHAAHPAPNLVAPPRIKERMGR